MSPAHTMAITAAALNRRITSQLILVTICTSLFVSSKSQELHGIWGRQVSGTIPPAQATPAPVAPSASASAASTASGILQTLNYPPIMQSMAPSTMTALPATYTAGTAATMRGAPPLPSTVLDITAYPALDRIPPIDSHLVRGWINAIDWSKVPKSPPNGLNGCSNQTNADAISKSGEDENCWWTCGGCTRPTDVVSCPDKGTWGASFDDGPSPDTPTLLRYLDQQKLKTTFFVVGSRVLSRPAMLQYEYQTGHQISIHTWSHPYLTTLTNEEIVAELGWSKKIIKDVIGVTPNTMRPPYGDIDDRVRYIAMAMGLTPIIWTTAPSGQTFDTQDWRIAAGIVTPAQVLHNFQTILAGAPELPTGFIVLAHDLYPQSVALAVEFVLPGAVAAGNLTIEPIVTCLGKQLPEAYIETANPYPNATSTINATSNSTRSTTPSQNSISSGKPPITSSASLITRGLAFLNLFSTLVIVNVV